MKKLQILLLFPFLLLECAHHIEDSNMIVGKYSLIRNPLKDSLYIYSNHVYTHRFHAINNRNFECKGNWEFNPSDKEIKFKDFLFFTDAGRDNLPPGDWYSKIEISPDSVVHLFYSVENNIFFEKK